MSSDDFQDSALGKALQRRKELRETIENAIQEIEKIEAFLKMYSSFSTGDFGINKQVQETPGGAPLRVAKGKTQSVFEMQVRTILRDTGRPMKSPEIIEEFRKRGHAIPGNEIRTAWNRLWEAKVRGTLTSDPKLGYWIAGEPLSEKAKEEALIAGKRRKSGATSVIKAARGTKPGRDPLWGQEQIEAAERLLLAGKSRAEVAAALGGVSMGTLQKYVSISGLKAKYPDVVIPKRPRRPSRGKRTGRPRVLTADKVEKITKMKAEGKTVKEITKALGLKQSTVYRFLQQLEASESGAEQIRTPEDSN
jgi:transposase